MAASDSGAESLPLCASADLAEGGLAVTARGECPIHADAVPVPEDQLPVVLPEDVADAFAAGDVHSPIKSDPEWRKTTCPEFGLTTTTESLLWGQTRNPWNLGKSAGGSPLQHAAASFPVQCPQGETRLFIAIASRCCTEEVRGRKEQMTSRSKTG